MRILLSVVALSLCTGLSAQTGKASYHKKNGEVTKMRDSAYFYREIESQKMDGLKLYRIKEVNLRTSLTLREYYSLNNKGPFTIIGQEKSYYPSGKLRAVELFDIKGRQKDSAYYYHPNGELGLVTKEIPDKSYTKSRSADRFYEKEYIAYSDSTGKSLLAQGEGFLRIGLDDPYNFEEGNLSAGKKEGDWIGMVKSGGDHYTFKETFHQGKLVAGVKTRTNGDSISYDQASYLLNPEYPGGIDLFMKYITANYEYPVAAVKNKVKGIIKVAFVVEKDGSLTEVKTKEDLGFGTGAVAEELIRKSKKWNPAIIRGEPVRVQYTVPIRLR